MKSNLPYYMAFSHFLGIGPMRFMRIKEHFSSLQKGYEANKEKLRPLINNSKLVDEFIEFRRTFNIEAKLDEIKKKKIEIITQENEYYPPQLLSISDAPICLYLKGNKDCLRAPITQFFGVVGTRRITSYGTSVTTHITKGLVEYGFTIVSGMALGVDSVAHKTAVAENGVTIAVLGCGVDFIYPPSNRHLYENIIRTGGVISEFPPGHSVLPGLFVARNRIISGLSKGVLIVEGDLQSGALITARFAGEQGRDVYAIPGPITSTLSNGPHMLLKNGAKMVTDIKDILEDFHITIKEKKKKDILKNLTSDEQSIINVLVTESLSADELVIKLELPIHLILHTLSMLELKGLISKNSEGTYLIA